MLYRLGHIALEYGIYTEMKGCRLGVNSKHGRAYARSSSSCSHQRLMRGLVGTEEEIGIQHVHVTRSFIMTDSASSQSTTPMLLTPESTGTNSPDAAAKKARRQTAFYPNMNSSNKPQKPFSRSAAKRESVMALGSIEHLQHYFTKTGLVSKQK